MCEPLERDNYASKQKCNTQTLVSEPKEYQTLGVYCFSTFLFFTIFVFVVFFGTFNYLSTVIPYSSLFGLFTSGKQVWEKILSNNCCKQILS